jgi:hypothetical protein
LPTLRSGFDSRWMLYDDVRRWQRAADCKPARLGSIPGHVSTLLLRDAACGFLTRVAQVRLLAGAPGSRSSRGLRKLGSHPSNAGSNPARDANMSLPADPVPTLRTLVTKVRHLPRTLLALVDGTIAGLRSLRTGFDSQRERCECGPPVGCWRHKLEMGGSIPSLATVITQGATRLS